MRTSLRILGCFLLLSVLRPPGAQADDEAGDASESYDSVAVQERIHRSTHEFTAYLGVLPLDAFTKGYTVSGSYALHFSDLWGWEVVHGFYSLQVDTDLKADLAALMVEPTPFEVLDYFVTSNVMFKPVYWKGALLNDSLIYGELFFVAGGGYGWFTRSSRAAIDLGLGIRLYADATWSFRLDIRHLSFFNDSVFSDLDLHHEIWAGLGVSLSF